MRTIYQDRAEIVVYAASSFVRFNLYDNLEN